MKAVDWFDDARVFVVFRVLLGLYLVVHFWHLWPWGVELFGREGLIPEVGWNLTRGLFPSPLNGADSGEGVKWMLAVGVLSAACLMLGYARPLAGVVGWYVWTCLFHRNNLISNPALPYVGLALLLCALAPLGEGGVFLGRRKTINHSWRLSGGIRGCMGWLLAMGYSFSGWTKLSSPSWVDGSALERLLENPLARPGWVVEGLGHLPESLLKVATWGTLGLELGSVLLWCVPRLRFPVWLAWAGLHAGILLVCDFADLTCGMLVAQWLVVDPKWWACAWGQIGKVSSEVWRR